MSSRRSLLTSALALGFGSAAFAQSVDFEAAAPYSVADEPDATAIGDWDGDGFADLAVTADAPDRIAIRFNLGDGTFGAPIDVRLTSSSSPGALIAGDFDGDTDLDLIVALEDFDQVQLVVNTAGAFAPGATFAVGARPVDVEAALLDANGSLDLVVTNRDGGSVTVLLNSGSGSFGGATTIPAGQDVHDAALGDFDGDSDVDAAVSSHDTRSIELLINAGDGSFSAGPSLSVGGQLRPDGLAAADLDGDGDADLAAATSGNALHFVSIFRQGAGGTFSGPVSFATGGLEPSSVVAADLDFDGDVDVAVTNQDSDDVSTLENLGAATFGAPAIHAVGTTPERLAGADLDGNGSVDLVSTDRDANRISVLRNVNADGWTDLGNGLAGANGIPRIEGFGTLRADLPVSLVLSGALANSVGFLIVGLDRVDAPFKGGVMVPSIDSISLFPVDAMGGQRFDGTWPSDQLAGEDFFLQAWIVDPAAVRNLSATNALQAVAQ